jgi:hypothetical protein
MDDHEAYANFFSLKSGLNELLGGCQDLEDQVRWR